MAIAHFGFLGCVTKKEKAIPVVGLKCIMPSFWRLGLKKKQQSQIN
jgi:hypothetical protein